MARLVLSRGSEQSWEEAMLTLRIEKIGELGSLDAKADSSRAEAAVKLREAVTNARIIVLDLSEVRAIEGI